MKTNIKIEDIPISSTRAIEIEYEKILLCRVDEKNIYAVENQCSHDDSPLTGGLLHERILQCPRHGAQFDVIDGSVKRLPAGAPLEVYQVRVNEEGLIEVDIDV